MTTVDMYSPIDLELAHARARLRLALPIAWSWQLIPAASGIDPEGKVTPRILARRDDHRVELQIAASHLRLPLGLTAAVAYWCSLYGLDVPNDPVQWGRYNAFISDSPPNAAPYVRIVWMQAADSIIELRVEADTAVLRDELLEWLQGNFECEPIASADELVAESWWTRVAQLRERGMLEAAITVAERDGDRAEALLVQAKLHAERMRRAQDAGHLRLAREAWQRATACACAYAASATSGGEGTARSLERDRVLADLGPEPAGD